MQKPQTFGIRSTPLEPLPTPTIEHAEKIVKRHSNNKTPRSIREALGQENVNNIISLITSPDLVDLDVLYLSSVISNEELKQYTYLLPQYRTVFIRMAEIAEQMSEDLYVQVIRDPDPKKAYSTIYIAVEGLRQHIGITDYRTFRNAFIDNLFNFFSKSLFIKCCSRRPGLNAQDLIAFHEKFLAPNIPPCSFSSSDLLDYFKEGQIFFEGHIPKPEPYAPTPDDARYETLLHDEILSLAENNTFATYTFDLYGYEIIVERPSTEQKPGILAHVVFQNPIKNQYIVSFIDRFIGDLCLANTSIPMNMFLPSHVCGNIRRIVLETTHKRLMAAEENRILNLPALPTAEFQTESADEELSPVHIQQWVREHVYVEALEGTQPEEKSKPTSATESPSKFRIQLMQRVGSLKVRHLVRALTRLLGEPNRIQGSHYIFSLNGKSFPIPFHSSESVSPGILTSCMNTFEITPREMLEALDG